ncbi:hypothetical protein DOU03_14650 [Clavibacter michiganensis subsp. michiganensis]|nr:hypothetical protein [Clavibacter michiganensis subsp. michiganensis]
MGDDLPFGAGAGRDAGPVGRASGRLGRTATTMLPGCPDARMPGCPDARMPGCPDARMPGCPDARTAAELSWRRRRRARRRSARRGACGVP